MMKVTMYTDGAARGNPDGPGGYGTVLSFVDKNGTEHLREFFWVKGHNGHPQNERCDTLATTAADGENLRVDEGLEEQNG